MKKILFLMALTLTLGFSHSKEKSAIAGKLKDLPTKAGAHLSVIKSLKSNQWVKLPAPKADPTVKAWRGKSYGRSWTPQASYSSELGGFFITGEGKHVGYDAKTNFYGDDVWFYHINKNQWIGLYPGTDITNFGKQLKDGTLKLDKKGFVRDANQQAIPMVTMSGHGGFLMTYDKANRKFCWSGSTAGWLGKPELLKAYREELKKTTLKKAPGQGLWMYDVAKGEFQRFPLEGPGKLTSLGFIQYVDSKKKIFVAARNGNKDWWYDTKTNQLTSTPRTGNAPKSFPAYGSTHDPKRDRVYVLGTNSYNPPKSPVAENHFYYYDVKKMTWVYPKAKNTPVFNIRWGQWTMDYDSVNDKLVTMWINNSMPVEKRFIHVYDPKTNSFAKPIKLPAEVMSYKRKSSLHGGYVHSCYVKELNVFFVFTAAGDNRIGDMWAYRLKKAKNK